MKNDNSMRKYFTKGFQKKLLIVIGGLIILLILFNYLLMPWYVSAAEVSVPKVVGLNEQAAKGILEQSDLEPVIGGERFDERYPKGSVIFQKPNAGSVVKEGRRIFLFVSSGIPLIKVPSLKGKVLRDARMTLERMDLVLGDTSFVESEYPTNVIIDQEYYEGTEVKKGTHINVTLSAGVNAGLITIPDLLGKSLSQAEKLITENKLTIGRINYQPSFSLLPNTVIDQYPGEGNLVEEGAAVDLFVTKNVDTPDEVE